MKVSILDKKDIFKVKNLIYEYGFNDYRRYRMLDKGRLAGYVNSQIQVSLNKERNWLLILESKKDILGLCSLHFLPWDTQHFGFNMAKIGYLMAKGDYGKTFDIKNKLISYALLLCRKQRIKHLSSRIDTADISGIHALENKGFKLMDTLVTYTFNKYRHRIPDIKDLYKIREFRRKDLASLINIAKRGFSKDRFHLDAHFFDNKADAIFGDWIKESCSNLDDNAVFVAAKDTKAIGFLCFAVNKELKNMTGYSICGHGLSAVSPEIKGVYPSLVKAAVKYIALNHDCLEFDSQLNNYEVIKVWQKFGFDFIRSKYTLHKKL